MQYSINVAGVLLSIFPAQLNDSELIRGSLMVISP